MLIYINTMVSDQDDCEFLGEMFEEFQKLMYSTAYRYISDESSCEDIIQTAMLRLIDKVTLLRTFERCTLASYIVSAIRNTSLNYIKAQNRERAHMHWIDDYEIDDLPSADLPLDDQLYTKERLSQLSTVWTKLSEHERFLLEGRYILGFSDAELATQVGCKPSSIRMKLTRARRVALGVLIMDEEERYL